MTHYAPEVLKQILEEFSAEISDPSPGSDERMRLLLKKYVKYYQESDGIPGPLLPQDAETGKTGGRFRP